MSIPLSAPPLKPCCTPHREHNPETAAVAPVATAPEGETHPPTASTLTPQTSCPAPSLSGMRRLDGGAFLMGTDSPEAWKGDGEGPVRQVTVSPFYLDICAVTNAQWEEFAATGYTTEAERFGWSYVFHKEVAGKAKKAMAGTAAGTEWWLGIEGACWKRPHGPGSNIRKTMDHPVVHISWHDAEAFCRWAGKRLPTEAEWEYASRGGLEQKTYPWGDELTPGGKHRCNIWQGKFPDFNSGADGFLTTAPVKSFAPNAWGFYNTSGNVWEWVQDWFSATFHINGPRDNPHGPDGGTHKVIKGGSYLCHASYCNRYRVAAKTANTPDSSTGHCGFRCALNGS